ncbi:MAG: tetratricopeptide repeat protein [Polyangiaceae bacterium]|nr:tetratricopeptide repeat protein [Polyangiaceae bacterium]
MARAPAAAFAALAATLGAACAPAAATPRTTDPDRLIAEAREDGLDIDNPLAIDDDMRRAVDAAVSRSSWPEERLRLLRDYLRGRLEFRYASSKTLGARDAWRERRGDCMAFTNLFVALARYLDIQAYFVHVREVTDYYERAGWFFVSSHVAVGFGSGASARVIDISRELSLWKEMSDWKLAAYQSIDDGEALALHYNNVAVDWMLSGKARDAERLFRFWLARAPRDAELHNNLGVLLNREGRYRESLALLTRAIESFPEFNPLYTNAILAARGAGRIDLAAELARRGHELERDDPFFIFARALNLYQDDAFREAAEELERARAAKPDSPVILAWLARAYLRSGQRAEGREAFERVRQIAPDGPLSRELRVQFPELR